MGLPIDAWDPHDLEVHPAGAVPEAGASGRDGQGLPGYVARGHDRVLAEVVCGAVGGRSAMVVLVGSSSTGKTRACWEAVRPLADHGWRLWHPFDPTRAEAALTDLARVGPQTVVWLNEAQHYLGAPHVGEQVAAAVHTLLTAPGRGPVLVLGTLWPEYADRYTRLARPGGPDPHSRVRELLAGRTLAVPDTFDDDALRAANTLARSGDRLLADTLTRAQGSGRIAQDLAGGPQLLRRYREATAPARALLQVAMDARRLGMGLHLPRAFLVDAAADYLGDDDWDTLDEDWAEAAFAELAHPVHGKHAPLRRTRDARRPSADAAAASSPPAAGGGPVYRLADYLEQHGRHERRRVCPLASFWETAAHTAAPEELSVLAAAAHRRGRYRHAALLYRQAADAGDARALWALAWLRKEAGDRDGANHLYRQAADAGNTPAMLVLADMRKEAGDRDGAERLYRQAADAGDGEALLALAWLREEAGDRDGVERLYRQAADASDGEALLALAWLREEAGDRDGAERLAGQAADAGDTEALMDLAWLREEAGDRDGAERLYRQAADAGNTYGLRDLPWLPKRAGDRARLRQEAVSLDNVEALHALARVTATGECSARQILRFGWEPDGSNSPPW
ncbi:tetratricopeptide repeat protein [Embleya sp. NPDC008237]|uniref:tetratricopeptide repeat protein n=1 Tax=Embleya sp. NPDC008237 TaxID=3363978 RepID=UPI0036E9370A